MLDVGRLGEKFFNGPDDLARALMRLLKAADDTQFKEAFELFCKILPPTDRLHLHRAIIGLVRSAVGRNFGGEHDISLCNTIQEAYSMLADAHTWPEQRIKEAKTAGIALGKKIGEKLGMDKGIALGEKMGLLAGQKNSLLMLLGARFGAIPSELVQEVENMKESNILDELIVKAAQAQNLAEFSASLGAGNNKKNTQSGNS